MISKISLQILKCKVVIEWLSWAIWGVLVDLVELALNKAGLEAAKLGPQMNR